MTYAHRDAYIFKLDSALPLNDDENIHEFPSTPTSTIAILVTCKAIIAFPSAVTSLYNSIKITTNSAVLHIQSYIPQLPFTDRGMTGYACFVKDRITYKHIL